MMKVSDPILFGHCVRVFFKDVFEKHGKTLEEIGANPNLGLGAVLDAIDKKLPSDKAQEIRNDIDACYEERPWLAMVNSDKGITNLVCSFSRLIVFNVRAKFTDFALTLSPTSTYHPILSLTRACLWLFGTRGRCGIRTTSWKIRNA